MELTFCDDVARERLGLILADKIMRFNPYRVTDEALVECAARGYWRPWPSLTQMLIFHFQGIKEQKKPGAAYYGLFFKPGTSSETYHYSLNTYSCPMTHLVTKRAVWMTLNGRSVIPSTVERLVGRDVFVSHAINCRKGMFNIFPSYRMHLLRGSVAKQADVIRRSMIQSKLSVLKEVMNYPDHPDYLAYSGNSFDYRTPILSAIARIRQFPNAVPSTVHTLP